MMITIAGTVALIHDGGDDAAIPDASVKTERMIKVINVLPPGCRYLLSYLLYFLKQVAAHSDCNKMKSSNLGTYMYDDDGDGQPSCSPRISSDR